MSFEPQKFFLGVVDFFAVILPGAILTYFIKDPLGPVLLGGPNYYKLVNAPGWVAFLGTSYLLGHFVFLAGAWLLDDYAYDPLRRATYGSQINRLAEGKRLSLLILRWLARIFFGKESDRAVQQAVKIKKHYAGGIDAADAINAFQWSKAKLILGHPAAIEHVHRFEADSKFFRSVVVLCILIMAVLVPLGVVRDQVAFVSIPVLVLAFWRYLDQRLKATTQSYWYMITLEGTQESTLRRPPVEIKPYTLTHAGGVVYRRKGREVEYLLVQAKRETNDARVEWVLPKGKIETGERLQETAVREVREEAGVWARVNDKLKTTTYSVKGKPINIQFYLMEAADHPLDTVVSDIAFALSKLMWWVDPKDRDRRERRWLPLEVAKDEATHREAKDLLNIAEELRLAIAGSANQ